MVSVGISKLGCTDLVFVDPGIKINGAYYRDVLLSKQLLPAMREVSGEFFVFQLDNAPAHRHVTLCDLFFAVTGSLASKQPSEPEDRTVLPCSPEICRISLRHDSLARHRGSGKCTVNLRTYGQPSRCSSILKSDCEACWK